MGDPALAALSAVEALIEQIAPHGRHRVLAEVDDRGDRWPIHALELGPERDDLPVLIVVGGVHGLERIGAEVVIASLASQLGLLRWDEAARAALTRARLWVLPILNPGGLARGTRANPRGVDLMRNAPSAGPGWATPLLGGHRLSARLPWYRGAPGAPMEPEAAALCAWVERAIARAPAAIALDVHSGFGLIDRIWFPWARTRAPLPHLAELRALAGLVEESLPHHAYRIEPQARTYTIQGDLWDHLYGGHLRAQRPGVFLPLTLEMGSWRWVKKNPRQLLSRDGSFNPIKPHRVQRTLRRHLTLIELLHRAAGSHAAWTALDEPRRRALADAAFADWYAR